MPIYAYECEECGVHFERRQSFSDDPITVCPECGGHTHRLIQPAGIIFKGSGFYVNDSKGSKANLTSPAKSDSTSEKSESTTASSKLESSSSSKSDD
jgi:putative FmdB family regulatory protein